MKIKEYLKKHDSIMFHCENMISQKADAVYNYLKDDFILQVFVDGSYIMVQVYDADAVVEAECPTASKVLSNLPENPNRIKLEVKSPTIAEIKKLTEVLGRAPRLAVEL